MFTSIPQYFNIVYTLIIGLPRGLVMWCLELTYSHRCDKWQLVDDGLTLTSIERNKGQSRYRTVRGQNDTMAD